MTKRLVPLLRILPPPQRRLWRELAAVPEPFVLYGGTALALHLGHRVSEDFDFFADRNIDPETLLRTVTFLRDAEVTQMEPNTLSCLVERGGPVRLSFFGLPRLGRVRAPHVCPGNRLKVASLLDLAATKAAVVQRRAEAKDYIDIDALIAAGIDLPQALSAAKIVYGDRFAPTPTLKALTFFEEGDLTTLPAELRRRLVESARAVDPLRLPRISKSARASPIPRSRR